ncbi:MAG: pyruvoyl-dependent arginine decarboxylase [Nocardioides sp.]|nr:pyruvoyl-dependent arginine decarboxylase [Nocardioides sp.]
MLDITVRTGSGTGRTLLSAFDHALQRAGVADFNLVTLSSVIPPGSRIRMVDATLPGGHGDVLFCVRAEAYAEHPGDIAWAGLGWCVDDTGAGLFVEHHGGSEQSVMEQIELSLADMKSTRAGRYGEVRTAVASAHCTDLPTCAIVVAAYRVSPWFEPTAQARPERATVPTAPESVPTAPAPPPAHQTTVEQAPVVHQPGAATGPGGITVTLEKTVDLATARRYYELYRDTFGDLEDKAAARQLLHEHEFLEEMVDDRVHKYVARDEDGEAVGITTLTADLETVPWISPPYFAKRYPEHHARGAIYYLGFTLVHPSRRTARVFHAMFTRMAELMVAEKAVAAWDMCLFNDERRVGGNGGRLLARLADITIEPVDRQTYYTGVFHPAR